MVRPEDLSCEVVCQTDVDHIVLPCQQDAHDADDGQHIQRICNGPHSAGTVLLEDVERDEDADCVTGDDEITAEIPRS